MHPLLKIHIEKKEFHHAYLLCGGKDCKPEAFDLAAAIISCEGKVETHPDFFYGKFDLFGISDSHSLKNWSFSRPIAGGRKVFMAEVFSFNKESSNALLKILEEPPAGTHFIIISPSSEMVIPTLRSRLTVIDFGVSAVSENWLSLSDNFLKHLPNKRLEILKKAFPEKSDKQTAVDFLNGLEVVLDGKIKDGMIKKSAAAMEILQKNREYVFDRASSVKMILENLALTLPQF